MPLNKVASGGELSRLMLALRVVLNNPNNKKTLVFDELDTGISGATASAVGDRLNKLAHNEQLLVITHSAQVAGFADKHFKISKQSNQDSTITSVVELSGDERINEIARIISGATITNESISTSNVTGIKTGSEAFTASDPDHQAHGASGHGIGAEGSP